MRLITWPAFAALFAVAVIAAAAPRRNILLYNPSGSVPRGFYVRSDAPPRIRALVTVRARDVARAYAASRDFTADGDRFLKRIAAVAGDHVCAEGDAVWINATRRLSQMRMDSMGHALPRWEDCRVLRRREVLLLGETGDSFDGRYWGPVDVRLIEGVWEPISF
jgi:type IV secretory pathway protease TraF